MEWMRRFTASQPYDEDDSIKGLVRHVLIRCGFTDTGQVMVCLVINGKENAAQDSLLCEKLSKSSGNDQHFL